MEKHSFYFKQFAVRHDRCAMKVGTDGVLIGAWTEVHQASSILDIGTGSGLIALMLAQRTSDHVSIDAVEVGQPDFEQATENVFQSSWPDKIKVFHSSLQNFTPGKTYDLIVSNPPYFINSSSPPSDERKKARHTDSLSYDELMEGVSRLLSPNGIFSVILPTAEGSHFKTIAKKYGLHPSREIAFQSRKSKPQERWLLEFAHAIGTPVTGSIVLYSAGDEWSDEYRQLVADYYL